MAAVLPPPSTSSSSMSMSSLDGTVSVDNDLDKQCSALGGLFQQIVNEMKVGGSSYRFMDEINASVTL
jgi:hypothetical protein